eukprot:2699453-Alexandrium_andersonii.AAC.1
MGIHSCSSLLHVCSIRPRACSPNMPATRAHSATPFLRRPRQPEGTSAHEREGKGRAQVTHNKTGLA